MAAAILGQAASSSFANDRGCPWFFARRRATSPWSNWRLWQYTGDGKCDLRPRSAYPIRVANIARAERNIFRGSNESLVAWWQDHAWLPGE